MKNNTKVTLTLFGMFLCITLIIFASYIYNLQSLKPSQKSDFCSTRCASFGAEYSTYLNKGAEPYCACKKGNSVILSNVFEKNVSEKINFTPEELRFLLQW